MYQAASCKDLIAAIQSTDKDLLQAILRRSEAAKQIKALEDGNVVAELHWSIHTHGFHDCSPASKLGFETVLHVACRLDFEPARSTKHRTRNATSKPTHLPLELWHHILSFLKRSDMDPDAESRSKLEGAPAYNDVNASTSQTPFGITPLLAAIQCINGRNDPDSVQCAIVEMLLACPSLEKNATGYYPLMTAVKHSARLDARAGGFLGGRSYSGALNYYASISHITTLLVDDPDVESSGVQSTFNEHLEQFMQEQEDEEFGYEEDNDGFCGCGCGL